MCCVRFDVMVLLANIFGSPQYKENMEIPIKQLIANYCHFLDDIMLRYHFFENSETDIDDCVCQYNTVLEWQDDSNKEYLRAKTKLERNIFNQIYPDTIAEKLSFAADICLGAWKLKQEQLKATA